MFPLLLRACRHFLSFGDDSTIVSILWRITSTTLCQNMMIWKISVSSLFSRGRISKAIHLSRRSVDAVPYSRELWTDYLTTLKTYAKPEDFIPEKIRCSSWLQMDAGCLLPKTP
uniref:uncharacterized protein LOC120331827 n=1 Tax=Styela clava TaxID=7725 RepID=UPI0019399D12|nr:uncharacterized protein LOC120331827 [Styela clava]